MCITLAEKKYSVKLSLHSTGKSIHSDRHSKKKQSGFFQTAVFYTESSLDFSLHQLQVIKYSSHV